MTLYTGNYTLQAMKTKGNTIHMHKLCKKFLIYQVNAPYGTLRYFMNDLLSAFQELNIQTTVVDLGESNALERIFQLSDESFDAVLSFNCFISNIKLSNGKYLQDYIHAPYYYFLVDHPMHHHAILKENLHDFHALCIDNYHSKYLSKYYPHIRSVHTVYHGGCYTGTPVAYNKRKIDVLFTGTFKPCNELLQIMHDSPEPASKISISMAKEMLSHPKLKQEDAFSKALQNLGIVLTQEEFPEWLNIIGNIVDHYIRGIYRDRLLETMAGEDYCVEIYGQDWEKCTIKADNIHFHPAVNFEENLELINHAKITIYPDIGFHSGAHERIFSSMLSKTLCISDRNQYLDKIFDDGKEILFIDYNHLDHLNEIIHRHLTDYKKAELITDRAYRKVSAEHTWKQRAEQITEIIYDSF